MTDDTLRVGDRDVALAEIEAALDDVRTGTYFDRGIPSMNPLAQPPVRKAVENFVMQCPAYMDALLSEVRRLRAVESAAREFRKWTQLEDTRRMAIAWGALDALLAAAPATGGDHA